jgi:Na+/H+-translocating membrane pyrophosphatase
MNENQTGPNSLLDTTDCLEAIGVFRGWKNFFFVIILVSLLLLQVSFWIVNMGYIRGECPDMIQGSVGLNVQDPNDAKTASAADENGLDAAEMEKSFFGVTFEHLAMGIRIVNAVLILTGMLYCLTILMALKISLVGRLGGINHICRAFFLSLLMVLLLLPWQRVFGGIVIGAIYTPCELVKWTSAEAGDILNIVFFYLRFSGFWLLILFLLIFSQLRSGRWTKTILRRLEVI